MEYGNLKMNSPYIEIINNSHNRSLINAFEILEVEGGNSNSLKIYFRNRQTMECKNSFDEIKKLILDATSFEIPMPSIKQRQTIDEIFTGDDNDDT